MARRWGDGAARMGTPTKPWRELLVVLAVAVTSLAAQSPGGPNPRYTGALPIQEWTPEETGGKTQSFSVIQHPATGLIYAGNEAGVLEYDGARWRRLPSPADAPAEGAVVRGLTWDDRGRLWGGMDNDVAIYTPDATGHWRLQTLRSRAPAGEADWGVVWQVRFHEGFVWCTTTKGILRIDARSFERRHWPVGENVADMGVVDGDVWFRHAGWKLLRAHEGEVEVPPVPALPDGLWVLGVTRSPEGVLQVEHADGVLELRDNRWMPLGEELGAILKGGLASRVRRFADGRRIISTRARSLVLADPAGRVLGRINEPAGVNFGVTPFTYLDRDGGLWMANASGIRRAQIDHVAVRHGPAQGLRGGVRRMAFDGDKLLVASAQGFFVRDAITGGFALQAGSPSDGQALLRSPAGGWLIAAGQRFGEWNSAGMVSAPGMPVAGLALAADPRDDRRVFIGGFNELKVMRRQADAWQTETTLTNFDASLYYAAGDAAGALWVSSSFENGVWRVTAPAGDWTQARTQRVDGRTGEPMPAALWRVTVVEGTALVFGERGIWQEQSPSGPLVPATQFAGLPKGAATPLLGLRSGRGAGVLYVAGAGEYRDRFWRGIRGQPEAAWTFTELLVPELRGQVRFEDMVESPDGGTLWLGGPDAAFSIDLAASPADVRAPSARWRGVRLLEGTEFLYAGAVTRDALALPLAERAVALEFSAADLRVGVNGRTGIEYRTRAAGVDRDWTAWSANAARELTNLPPGDLRLEVQARHHFGAAGPVAVLTLTVPPFWWETWWARTLAVLAGVALVATVVRAIVRRQFKQRIALLEAQAAVQNERLRIARDMHDDLGSTLASIVHLSDGAQPKEQAGPALARVHDAARDLVQRTRDIVWAATPQHDSLESLIEQMSAHAERTLGDRGIAVKVDLPVQVPEEAMPSAVRHDVFLAFKEAVNNAAKYSQAKTATLRVVLQSEALVIELADDGVGFAAGEVKGTGNGLPNLRNRLAAFGGAADIASAPGRGTTVTLRVPRTARKL